MKSILYFLILLGDFQCQAVELRCYLKDFDHFITTALDKPRAILPCLDLKLVSVFYAFGINGSATGDAVKRMMSTFLSTNEYNAVLLDWSREARIGWLGTEGSYAVTAAPSAEVIGCQLGEALVDLVKAGLDATSVYLIGHSLGAHLMGKAGRCAQIKGFSIPRITGLDPSGPLFDGILHLPRLDKRDALFVDIVHTDPGGLGINTSTAHVNIYPNYRVTSPHQPGCPTEVLPSLSVGGRCAHDRSWMLYSEGILYPKNLPAVGAVDDYAWRSGNTNGITYIGPVTNLDARGNFYLVTSGQSPFGLGTAGLSPS